jgi:hypothetical protein
MIIGHINLARLDDETDAESFEIGLLAGPATVERSPAIPGSEQVKGTSFGDGHDAPNQWLEIQVSSNLLDIYADFTISRYGENGQVMGAGHVEPQPLRGARVELRFAARSGDQTKRARIYAQVAGQQEAKRCPSDDETPTVVFEAISPCPVELRGGQRLGFGQPECRPAIELGGPHMDLVSRELSGEAAGHVVASSLWRGISLILLRRTSATMVSCGASVIDMWSPGTE